VKSKIIIFAIAFIAQTFPITTNFMRKYGFYSLGCQGKECIIRESKVLGTENYLDLTTAHQIPLKPESLLNTAPCRQKLTSWLSTQDSQWGVVVHDLARNEKFLFNNGQQFHAASVMKLATAVSVFEWMNKNSLSLDSAAQDQAIRDRLALLINRSDNNQWAVLGSIVGLKNTQDLLQKEGLAGSNIFKNTMTPQDVSLLLHKIYSGKLVNQEQQQFLLTSMQNTMNENRIPAGLPKDIITPHKYGTWQANIHDAGIVFANNPYIIVVMTNSVYNPEQKIAQFSNLVYQIINEQSCLPK
jgi:beta-lactamase class A